MDRLKILIVEDDRNVADLYDLGLKDSMFEKRFARSGKQALETYTSWKPDIMLLDIMLPEMTGYSLLKEIRTGHRDSNTTIVMASSLSHKEDVTACIQLGIQGYIVKPFQHKDIAQRIFDCYMKHA